MKFDAFVTPVTLGQAAPYAGILLFCVLAFTMPSLSPTGQILSLATTAAIIAIGGSGLGFLWGQSGQLTLAHGAVYGLGAYCAGILASRFGFSFVQSLPFSILIGLVGGGLVALPSLRTKGHYFVILTFAIGEIFVVIAQRWDTLTGGANGMVILPRSQEILGLSVTNRTDYYRLVILFLAVVVVFLCALMRSRWGKMLRGMRENADLAASLGVNVTKHRIIAFSTAGAIAGLAGQLFLYQVKFIAPTLFNTNTSITFLLITLLGGKAYLFGPIAGAVVYFFLSEMIGLPPILNQVAFGALLIVMILVAPNGLLSLGGYLRQALRKKNKPTI